MEGRVNVTGEPRATFNSARGLSYICSILFMHAKITRLERQP